MIYTKKNMKVTKKKDLSSLKCQQNQGWANKTKQNKAFPKAMYCCVLAYPVTYILLDHGFLKKQA